MVTFADVEAAREAMEAARDRVNSEYWTFTRCARGKPVSAEAGEALAAATVSYMLLLKEFLKTPWVPTEDEAEAGIR